MKYLVTLESADFGGGSAIGSSEYYETLEQAKQAYDAIKLNPKWNEMKTLDEVDEEGYTVDTIETEWTEMAVAFFEGNMNEVKRLESLGYTFRN